MTDDKPDTDTAADGGDAPVTIEDNRAAGSYELRLADEQVGRADYRELDDVVVISHVEVDPRFGGRGLAAQLTRFALDDLRTRERSVWPVCPYVRSWIAKNTEYVDLVPEADRGRFGL